jgi:hypothetical protein
MPGCHPEGQTVFLLEDGSNFRENPQLAPLALSGRLIEVENVPYLVRGPCLERIPSGEVPIHDCLLLFVWCWRQLADSRATIRRDFGALYVRR